MSRDKNQGKRAYSLRGASTKRHRKTKGGGGKKSKPGHSYITTCSECSRGAEGSTIACDASTKEVSCKAGHSWKVV